MRIPTIAVDFDGTLVEHQYPDIGLESPGAVTACKAFIVQGARLILWTMRSGPYLTEAIDWCKDQGLNFWAHNTNPEQHSWTTSPKAYANLYIDDAAFGCPLREGIQGTRLMVDWSKVRPRVEKWIRQTRD